MFLFSCQTCGKVICVDDDCRGQRQPCPYCQAVNEVPNESSVDCCLVYHSPEQPAGQPMTSAELQELLEAGSLYSTDLILTKQVWRPLYQVLGLPLPVSAPQNDQAEIAVRFEELAPLPGFAPLPRRVKSKGRRAKTKSAPVTKQAGPAVGLGERLKHLVFLLVAFAVVVFGVVRAMRIYNYVTKRLGTVLFLNGTEELLSFELPFSGFTPVPVMGKSSGSRENLVVGIPCRKKAIVRQMVDNDYESDPLAGPVVAELEVPIRPGRNTVVNYGNMPLAVYRGLEKLSEEGERLAPVRLCEEVVSQIAGGKEPSKLQELFDQAQDQLRSYFVEISTEEIFTDDEYDFKALSIPDGERPEEMARNIPTAEKQLILTHSSIRMFQNGQLVFQKAAELQNITVKLPRATYRPVPRLNAGFDSEGVLTIARDAAGALHAEVKLSEQGNVSLPVQFQGTWSYYASRDPDGKWTWTWRLDKPGEKALRITADGQMIPVE